MAKELFDRKRLKILPLGQRVHDMTVEDLLDPAVEPPIAFIPNVREVARRILAARQRDRPVIWMMGAHVIKQGLSPTLIAMMEAGMITHVAMNGACVIHDYELAHFGATTESVGRYIRNGQFGLWQETGEINTIVNRAAPQGRGFGEAIGHELLECQPPHLKHSILATAALLNIPATVHVSIGQDIIHEHPNFDGAATGAASYYDFLVLTQTVTKLEGGVFLNVGSAVMGPEVYLKALAMARNVAAQNDESIRNFTTGVFDLIDLGDDLSVEASKSDARYYYRPFKTILVRTVQDGGESFYVRGDHRETIPLLYRELKRG